jgi:hypothetical protein
MALQKSKLALGQVPVVSLMSGLVASIPYEHIIAGALAAGDIIALGPIEPGVKPYDATLITDDLDSNGTPTITLTVGILNAGMTDIDAAATSSWIAASTAGQTGGIARATSANVYLAGASSTVRQLGVKVVAGPATAASDGKKIAVLLKAGG